MRIELTPVRIFGTLAGWGKQQASDDMTEAGTKSSGRRLSRHGSARIPAPSLEPLSWMGPAVQVVSAGLDRAIPMASVSDLCRSASRLRGGSTTLVRNLIGSADPQWLGRCACSGYPAPLPQPAGSAEMFFKRVTVPGQSDETERCLNERTATPGSSVRSPALPRHASTAAALGPQKLL